MFFRADLVQNILPEKAIGGDAGYFVK